jgi:hypothetical protein
MTSFQNRIFTAAALVLTLCGAVSAQALPKIRSYRFVPNMSPPLPGTSMKPDQVNSARWDKAWTNLLNDVEQSFTPSMPKLLGVEVELIVGNSGPNEDELTLTVLDSKGHTVAVVTQPVETTGCDHTMFVIPKDGIKVTPGEMYWLKLTGGSLFGWKYVVGGYDKGAATFNGKPLLPGTRSTFLFRTFGAD